MHTPRPFTRRATILLMLLISLLAPSSLPYKQVIAQSNSRVFPQTGKTVEGKFLQYWQANGGLTRQGYPISDEMSEISSTNGKPYTVQYFERAVFELHPENSEPHVVLLSLLGTLLYTQKYPGGANNQAPNSEASAITFSQTGKRVGGRFLSYWQANGGLPQFGYPLSDEFNERSNLDDKTYRVQYFERAVFEYHPENSEPYKVLIAQLGTFRYQEKYTTSTTGEVVGGPNMEIERSCHTATLLNNGKVLIAGGMIREGNFSPLAELYDPATSKFSPTGSLNRGRACHTATLLHDGKVLIVAGDWDDNLDSAELYDPITGKFTMTGSLNQSRNGNTATLLNNGKVLIVGGYDHDMLNSIELYDPATGKFTLAGNMNEARSTPGASLLVDGRVLITGGGYGGKVLSSAELYDPTTGKFTPTGNMTLQRHKHAQVTMPDGQVLITGGANGRDWSGQYSQAELYNPQTGTFTPTGSMQANRFKIADATALLPNGQLLVAGASNLAELYNPTTQQFTTAKGDTGAARYYQTATTLPNGTTLIAGGYDTNIRSTKSTWLYKP